MGTGASRCWFICRIHPFAYQRYPTPVTGGNRRAASARRVYCLATSVHNEASNFLSSGSGVTVMSTKRRAVIPALLLWVLPVMGMAQVGVDISVNVAPPDLPVYDQPPIPAEGYLWTPGYWAWSDDDQDYYWVPGTWVLVPQPGYLWTPGNWNSGGGVFYWHAGYWGPLIGFYGGVNYGYGYVGRGFEGGYWQGGRLYYNQSVVNVGTTNITNVYNRTLVNNVTINRVSYNGGSDGVQAQPTAAETSAVQTRHLPPTAA